MYKSLIICGVFAFALTQTAFGQTQDNRYLVGSSANIIQQRSMNAVPAINTSYGNVATPNLGGGCDSATAAYGSIGSGCDARVTGGGYGAGGGGCDSAGGGCGCGTAGGCDAGPSCGGGGCGATAGGCGLGQNFFSGGNCGGGGCGDGGCSEEYWRTYAGWNDLDGLGPNIFARDGWAFGAAFGKRKGNVRRELDFTHRDNSWDAGANTGTLTTTSVMANVLFDIEMLQINDARSYVGAGIGGAYTDIEADGVGRSNDTAFAYQFIAGMQKPLGNGAKAFAEYRYFSTLDMDFGGGDVTFDNQNIFFGLEFRK